jgi:Flp pilus assembly protein TadG
MVANGSKMMKSRHATLLRASRPANQSGQAAVEFGFIAPTLIILLLAVIDFGRVLTNMEVMVGLTRQGSNLASRGTSLSASAAAVVAGDAPLDLNKNGEVIITSVANVKNVYTITGQTSQGGISRTSQIGTGVGNKATVPAASATILQNGQTIYVTEVFYTFQPITPIGQFMNVVMPSTLYEIAYF